MTTMTSRERTLAAVCHEEPDRVPIFFRGVAALDHLWQNPFERVDVLLEMGVDDKVGIGIGPRLHPDVTVRDWFEEGRDSRYRLACREYDTPKGALRAVMRCTEDCRYEDGVPLASDHNISRGVEFLVKGRDDLPKLAYLLQEPSREDIAQFRDRARRTKEFASQKGVLVEGDAGPGGDLAFFLCGPNVFYLIQDDAEFGDELLEMIYQIGLRRMEIALAEGVDIVDARGCYETAPLWSPRLYDQLFAPRLMGKAELAHQAGAKLSYFSSGDFVPHMDSLLRTGVDIINAVRPFPGGVNDMRVLKERIGHRICLWGGLNPEEDIVRATEREVCRSVMDVIRTAAPGGGFVLSTGGSIFDADCYDNVMTLIRAALEFGQYPIDVARLEGELGEAD